MKLRLHYVEFRPSSAKTGSHLRKGKFTVQINRPFEVEAIDLIGSEAQKLWDTILAEGKEVEFRRVEVYALDWQPASD